MSHGRHTKKSVEAIASDENLRLTPFSCEEQALRRLRLEPHKI